MLWKTSASALPAVLILCFACAALAGDGPYVVRGSDGAWVARAVVDEAAGVRAVEERLGTRKSVVVPPVGALPEFTVRLRGPAKAAADAIAPAASAPLFVVADTHGEFEIVVELLRKHTVIDDRLQWVFGNGHLVVLGDVFDRGPHQLEILWLLYELEAQAAKAGGGVHLVLGNHEVMALTGDLRYLHPKYVRVAQLLGVESYAQLFDARSVLGQWLRTRATVLKVRDMLCLHGGISPAIAARELTPARLNAVVRNALATGEPDRALSELVLGPDGPLWYRGYFPNGSAPAEASADEVSAILRRYRTRMLLVGHTRVPTVTSLYDGRVIAVQVYPRRDEADGHPIMEAVRIDGTRVQRARIDGALEAL